ncbi:MAG: hypothetical protein VX519_01730 [Myxococcota bacterium]|nr:hypothetical protein [Myxococcota bacterium]
MRRVAAMLFGSGGGISSVGFFLPWISFSCAGEQQVFTGADLAQEGSPELWLVFVFGLVVISLAAFFLMGPQAPPKPLDDLDIESTKRRLSFERRHSLGHVVVLIASLCAIGLLIVEYLQQMQNTEAELKALGHSLSALDIRIESGAWASSLGFVAACVGSVLGLRSESKEQNAQGS